jgi:hypothetical protein
MKDLCECEGRTFRRGGNIWLENARHCVGRILDDRAKIVAAGHAPIILHGSSSGRSQLWAVPAFAVIRLLLFAFEKDTSYSAITR